MSLLLDALKRAEQEKLARQGQDPPPDETAPAGASTAAPVIKQHRGHLELESVEVSTAGAAAAAAAAAPPRQDRDREGVKAVFAAKQSFPAAAPAGTARNRAVLAIGIGALVLLAAGGAYVWYEIGRTPLPIARSPMPAAPKPVTPAPVPAPEATGGVPAPVQGKGPDAVPPVAVLTPEKPAAAPVEPAPRPKANEQLVKSLIKESAVAKTAPPLKLSRTIEAPGVSPDVSRGYEALRRGDAAAARRNYEAAVAADGTNIDAHLGLATAAARTGDRVIAARQYRRTLELDPQNPSAIAGLAALADFSRPDALEAQLRADITRYPQSPALHYTLGNLHASQERWNEAQSAYFEAYRLDSANADVAYNLAVSLDHLGQAKLAADFYQRALVATQQQNAQFDKGQVSRRIAELKP